MCNCRDVAVKIVSGGPASDNKGKPDRTFEYSALLDLGYTAETKVQRLGLVFENGWTSNAGSGMNYYCDDQHLPHETTFPCGIVFATIDCVVGGASGPVMCKQL